MYDTSIYICIYIREIPPLNSLVWGSLTLAPTILGVVCHPVQSGKTISLFDFVALFKVLNHYSLALFCAIFIAVVYFKYIRHLDQWELRDLQLALQQRVIDLSEIFCLTTVAKQSIAIYFTNLIGLLLCN